MLVLFFFVMPAFAQDSFRPVRISTPPMIDGKLDDQVWKDAPSVSGLKTFVPDIGQDMSENTVVYMAYDNLSIYVAFRCFDTQQDKIKTSISSRDNSMSDDLVAVYLDPFNDKQFAYGFWFNPMGIQNDAIFTNTDTDMSFDAVMFSKGILDGEGYTVEIQIPFKSLRYMSTNPVEMGIIFQRSLRRTSEAATVPPLGTSSMSSIFIDMMKVEFYDIQRYTLMEIIPAVTSSHKNLHQEGNFKAQKGENDFSLTTKYGITSKLVFDATLNPDFSQVEADAGQVDVNLRYDLFYPEKRPFFLEGQESYFHAGASEYDAHAPLHTIIHTRNIVDPVIGAKLTGKIGSKNTLALMYAMDDWKDPEQELNSDSKTHFLVTRYKRTLKDNSFIGFMATSKEIDSDYNRVGGIDGQWMLNQSNYFKAHGFFSSDCDQGQKTVSGHAFGIDYLYYTRKWIFNAALQEVARDFRTRIGYITRTGISRLHFTLLPRFYPEKSLLRRIDVEFSSDWIHDKVSDLMESKNQLALSCVLPMRTVFTLGGQYATESFSVERFNISAVYFRGESQISKYLNLNINLNRSYAILYSEDPYQGRSGHISFGMVFQPWDQLNLDASLIYTDFFRDADSRKIYDYTIMRNKLTFQVNRYLFLRGIVEYNDYRQELLTDFLASFTYIPGTVIHFGYGSFYEKIRWEESLGNSRYVENDQFLETKRGIFFKASYLWRL